MSDVDYGEKVAETEPIEMKLNLNGETRVATAKLRVCKVEGKGHTLWLMMDGISDGYGMFFVVGIQSNGSIIRALGMDQSRLPCDPREGYTDRVDIQNQIHEIEETTNAEKDSNSGS